MIDIARYEKMMKLELSQNERELINNRINFLLDDFKKLEDVDASDIKPLVTVLDVQNVFRKDISIKQMTRDELLQNAPEQYDGCFQVPKTLE